MSSESTRVTERHFRYVAERTTGDDPFLRSLRETARAEGIPPIWIAPEQLSFIQILLKLAKARQVVEVGTLAGSTAIGMARALPADGKVRTIEFLPKHAEFARRWIAKSDVSGRVEVLEGDAKAILPNLPSDSADAALLDADKAGYPAYLRECLRIVRTGGMILADNAFAFGQLFDDRPTDREVPAVRAFNDLMAREARLHAVIVPIGDGCWVGVKK